MPCFAARSLPKTVYRLNFWLLQLRFAASEDCVSWHLKLGCRARG